ncbi:MAG: hypothetical protein ACETVV_02605 [Nitrososphaeria archaeon]
MTKRSRGQEPSSAGDDGCEGCGASDWEGYLRCRSCLSFYVWGKCRMCGRVRMESCPRDGGELEYIEARGQAE